MVDENTLHQIWRLTNELAVQQSANKETLNSITTQMSDVKQRSSALLTSGVFNHNGEISAISHRGTLSDSVDEIRPNSDSKSESQPSLESSEGPDALATKYSELKRQLRSTTSRNQQLESECAQLKRILQDYEAGLETATTSMRLQVNSQNDAILRLQSEYNSLLASERETTSALFFENKLLQMNMSKIAKLLREMYALDTQSEQETIVKQLMVENQGLRDALNKDVHFLNLGADVDSLRGKSSDSLLH